MLVCHSPPLYGSLYGHVKVWDSICRADMARAGWITGVCGYTNSTYLPFNYWLLLFVKTIALIKWRPSTTTLFLFTVTHVFGKGSPLSWTFPFIRISKSKSHNWYSLYLYIYFLLSGLSESCACVFECGTPSSQITLQGSQGHLLGTRNNKNWTRFLHVHWNSIKIWLAEALGEWLCAPLGDICHYPLAWSGYCAD